MTRGALVCIKRIYQKEGFFGFYRGWAPMLCRYVDTLMLVVCATLSIVIFYSMNCSDVLPYGIYMLSYEYMIRVLDDVTWINAKRREHKCKSHKSFVCPNNNCFTEMCVTTAAGSVAGLLSWMFVIPFDVMKTIMQSQSDPNKYPKMRHVVKAKTNVSDFYNFAFVTRTCVDCQYSISFAATWMAGILPWRLDAYLSFHTREYSHIFG